MPSHERGHDSCAGSIVCFYSVLRIVGTVDLVARFSLVKEGQENVVRTFGESVRINILFASGGEYGRGSRRFSRMGLRTGSHPLAPVDGSTQLDIVLDRVYKRQYVVTMYNVSVLRTCPQHG